MWKKFDASKTSGIVVSGEDRYPRTRWFNHLFLKLFGWRTVILFEVSPEDAKTGYRIGYIPFQGSPRLMTTVCHAQHFRMRIGRETCVFFAIRQDGTEVHLQHRTRAKIDDPRFTQIPLY